MPTSIVLIPIQPFIRHLFIIIHFFSPFRLTLFHLTHQLFPEASSYLQFSISFIWLIFQVEQHSLLIFINYLSSMLTLASTHLFCLYFIHINSSIWSKLNSFIEIFALNQKVILMLFFCLLIIGKVFILAFSFFASISSPFHFMLSNGGLQMLLKMFTLPTLNFYFASITLNDALFLQYQVFFYPVLSINSIFLI